MKKAAKKTAAAKPTSLTALREGLAKRYGNALVRSDEVKPYTVVSTGSLSLDLALRVGGYVTGRIYEIVGPEGVGKTTLAICSMIEFQQAYPDRAVGYIDMEQTFDYDWAVRLGLNTHPDRFIHIYPDDSEDVSDILRQMADTGLVSAVVVDSIGGMESKEAFEKDAGEKVMGRNAQVITRMVKHCAVLCRRNEVTAILINQLRANLSGQGSDISAGPKAMRYSTTAKISMSRTATDAIKAVLPGDDEAVEIGREIRARVSRSKVSVQGKAGTFWLFNADTNEWGPVGINRADEAVTVGLYTQVIEQKGAWYFLNTGEKFQGKAKLLDYLRANPEIMETIREQAIDALSHEVLPEVTVTLEHEGATA